jgi:predicted naringenin-chalcone synthase
MSYITSIGRALPEYASDQMVIHAFMEKELSGNDDDRTKLKLLYERSAIKTRYSVLPDFSVAEGEQTFFKHHELQPQLEQRLEMYYRYAPDLAAKAIVNAVNENELNTVTHLITVSCTGMWAPGLDIAVLKKLGLNDTIQRTSVNFMGCYAAIHALKMADSICRSYSSAKVLIVCVELCTIHFQRSTNPEQLTANALFADGASACLVQSDAPHPSSAHIQLHSFYSRVVPNSHSDMAWHITQNGFLMQLSSYVPFLIQTNIAELVQQALEHTKLQMNDISCWAFHPGGRKILDYIASELKLKPHQLTYSYDTLANYGNMSSATLLFVMKQLLADETAKGYAFGAAFGPGLTMETFIAKKHVA